MENLSQVLIGDTIAVEYLFIIFRDAGGVDERESSVNYRPRGEREDSSLLGEDLVSLPLG